MTNKETRAVFDRLARHYLQEMIVERPADLDKIDAMTLVWRIVYDHERKARKIRMIWKIAHRSARAALADSGLPEIDGYYVLPPLAVTVADGQEPARPMLTA